MASQPVPVEPCEGWTNPCSYCEKRFSGWIPIEEEEAMSSVPAKPGVFMFAFESKREKETVAIGFHKVNIQTSITPMLRDLRRQISHRKMKETKASIFLRYLTVEDVESKDATYIFAHWQNYGVLPRMTTKWPGMELLKKGKDFEYYEENQKWCYPIKDPIWRKQKVNLAPQAVQKCKGWTQNCSYCDSKFTIWLPLEEVVNRREDDRGPEKPGFAMFAASKQGRRQVVHISTSPDIRANIKFYKSWIPHIIKQSKTLESDSMPEVRWMAVNDLQDTDSCFMYAHFFNCGEKLLTDQKLPGAEILENSENFVLRPRDKQWCYDEGQASQTKKVSKTKERREMLRSMFEELRS